MVYLNHNPNGGKLQATLASSTAGPPQAPGVSHHPITCRGDLRYEPDGTFCCEHASVPPEDIRTRLCVDHSLALLLIELAQHL